MGHRRVSPLGVIARDARYRRDRADSYAAPACRVQIRTVGSQDRRTQRKPMWLIPVSTICGRRAAGR